MLDTLNDDNYSVLREAVGPMQDLWIARFCGEWIGTHLTETGARGIADEHNERRVVFGQIPIRTYR